MLEEYSDWLPSALRKRVEESIVRAVTGEIQEERLKPAYTNIALMHGFLWTWAGHRVVRRAWLADGGQFAAKVYALFQRNGTFEECNTPTYYGVDLYALGLWRDYGPAPELQRMGADMEAGLWKDIVYREATKIVLRFSPAATQ